MSGCFSFVGCSYNESHEPVQDDPEAIENPAAANASPLSIKAATIASVDGWKDARSHIETGIQLLGSAA